MAFEWALKRDNEIEVGIGGFSWTTLIFGGFVPLLRKDYLWFIIMIIPQFLTVGLSNIIFAFFYNNLYTNKLLKNGFKKFDPNEIVAVGTGAVVVLEKTKIRLKKRNKAFGEKEIYLDSISEINFRNNHLIISTTSGILNREIISFKEKYYNDFLKLKESIDKFRNNK